MANGLMKIGTFPPPPEARGAADVEFEGNHRRGELRGILKINQKKCVGCDTCRKVCPADGISGGLGVAHSIRDDACLYCGQCLVACPFGAVEQMSFVDEVIKKLDDPRVMVVGHPAPAVRVAIGEEFGAKAGELCTNQMLNAMEKAGFTNFDVNLAADQTIIEEGTEFVKKVQYWVLGMRGPEVDKMAAHPFPHFTSCCPAWIKNLETFYAHLIPHVSTAKSPIQMGGAMAKTWAAENVWKRDPREIYMVSVTPCTAKIFEASRPEFQSAHKYLVREGKIPADTPAFGDIDAVVTTRDLAEIFRRKGINPLEMSKERPASTMEVYTGAATIFGAGGGVMEAALRTAYYALSGEELKDHNLTLVRAFDNALLEATIPVPIKALGGKTYDVKIAVVNGAAQSLDKVLRHVMEDKNRYHFVEVMNCPGGCVNGGGQPVQPMGTSWLNPVLPLPLRA
ncbi:MAG: [Fe-Fe] hydrogenase large subunit C-terminal domain-containing protein [Burkholderiaceae bacterium]